MTATRVRPTSSSPSRVPFRRVGLFLLLSLLLLPLLPLPTQAALNVAPAMFHIGHIGRNETYDSALVLKNGGVSPVDLRLEVVNDPMKAITLGRSNLTLVAGSSGSVAVGLRVPLDATPGRHEPSIVANVVRQGANGTGQEAVRLQMPYLVAAADIATLRYLDNGTLWVGFVNGHPVHRDVTLRFQSGPASDPIETAVRSTRVESLRTWPIWLPLNLTRYGEGATNITFNGTATAADGTTAIFSETSKLYRRGNVVALGALPPLPPSSGGGGGPPTTTPAPPATVRQVEAMAPVERSDGSVQYGTRTLGSVAAGEEIVFTAPPEAPFDSLAVGFEEALTNVRLEVVSSPRLPDGTAPLPGSVAMVTAFQIKAYQDDQVIDGTKVGEVRFGFSFDVEGPAALPIPPDDVVLLHERAEGWRGESTRRLPDQDGRHRFEASFRSFSAFAVVDRRTIPDEMLGPTPAAPLVRLVMPSVVGPGDDEVVVEVPATMEVTLVRLYVDGMPHGETTAPPFRFPLSVSRLSEGEHVAHAVVEDGQGTEWTSDPVTFQVVHARSLSERDAHAGEPDALFLVALMILVSVIWAVKRRSCRR